MSANQVAHQLQINARTQCLPNRNVMFYPTETEGTTSMVHSFAEEEDRRGVISFMNNKAAGRDDVLVEQLKNLSHVEHK